MKSLHYAQYGNTIIKRAYCEKCKRYSLIIDGMLQCCGRPISSFDTHRIKVMCEAQKKRRLPLPKVRKKILEKQGNKCIYCGIEFGTFVYKPKGNKIILMRVCWDHRVPFSYGYNNDKNNFVASCQICNGMKSNLIFDTLEEVREYLKKRWEIKGYEIPESSSKEDV